MIRAANENDMRDLCVSEAAIRITAAYETYGLNTRFLQIFADETDTRMSLMDGVAVLDSPNGLNDEWICFISMQPDVKVVRTDAAAAAALAKAWGVSYKSGDFMTYSGPALGSSIQTQVSRFEDLYAFLCDYFALPPFDSWYVDVSHRVRHGCCHIASVIRDNQVVCNAMSVAETTRDVLLGAVATHPQWRRQGLAAGCVEDLIGQLSGTRRIHISPVDDRARHLYEKIGFSVSGSWGEVARV